MKTKSPFVALKVEGGLFPGEFLNKVANFHAKHQRAEDYRLARGLNLRDEIGRAWRIAEAEWRAFRDIRNREDVNAVLVAQEWQIRLLKAVLGYEDIVKGDARVVGDRLFPLSHGAEHGSIPLLLTAPRFDLDRGVVEFGEGGTESGRPVRRRSPHALVQEYLNAAEGPVWGLVGNGDTLRLLRENPSLTRPAYVEADLAAMFEEGLFADFATFWLLFHASRLRGPHHLVLEAWRSEAHETGERALEHLREGVTEALCQLGTGFVVHPENNELRSRLQSGALSLEDYFQQLLRLVYRLIFLFTAEDRELLHSSEANDEARVIYRSGYSASLLRERALKSRFHDNHSDLGEALLIVFHGLALGCGPLALPALGGLFREDQCPDLMPARIANRHLLGAIFALTYFRTGDTLSRVNFRDQDTEELGSVYESLLELHPRLYGEGASRRFGFMGNGDEAGESSTTRGSERKRSGSYYTPDSLVQELIRTALEPVIERALNEHPENPRQALLQLKVCDPACGSGHFLLAAARRLAHEVARLDAVADVPDETLRRHALREVVGHCLYGVDKNPLAVELCKTALWLEALEPGRPLGFLNHHIRCGDALVGVLDPKAPEAGVPAEAFKPLSGDDKETAKRLARGNREALKALERERERVAVNETLAFYASAPDVELEAMPEEDLAQVEAKAQAWQQADSRARTTQARKLADLFIAAFFTPKTLELADICPTTLDLHRVQRDVPARPGVLEAAQATALRVQAFHWPLAFPEVFARGGFDVLLGNPPWEVSQLGEEEFFAVRLPSIAKLAGEQRKRAIAALQYEDSVLWGRFRAAKSAFESTNQFFRESGRYSLTAYGKLNAYALFAETFLRLLTPYGRAGFIVPSGIATDDSTKDFFEAVSTQGRLVSLFDFENRNAVFPGVHRSYKFCLFTLSTHIEQADFVFFATSVEQLADKRRRFTLSPADILCINPNTKTAPVFRSQADAELTKKIHRRVPVLIQEGETDGNPWGISFRQGLFNMTSDSNLFRSAAQLRASGAWRESVNWVEPSGAVWVPLYEAKMGDFYDHRAAGYDTRGDSRGYRVLPDTSDDQHCDPTFEPAPFYWVPESEVQNRLGAIQWGRGWLFGFKDVTSATNERTFIGNVLPRWGLGHNMPVLIPQERELQRAPGLVANLGAIVFDYLVRQKTGGVHLSFFYVKQFPILPPSTYGQLELDFIVPRVLELIYTSQAMKPFAEDMGYDGPVFPWNPERRAQLRAELDAYYAKLYGLSRDELRYILHPADVMGEDYPSETFRVLKDREMREFGEYRTQRLVLEAWDRLPG